MQYDSINNQIKEKEISQLKNTKPKSLEHEIQFKPIYFLQWYAST